jgi:hypothetical protein
MMNMKNMCLVYVVLMALLPDIAYSAGTYYTGGYRSPQQNYSRQNYTARQQSGNSNQQTKRTVSPNANVYVGRQYQAYNRDTSAVATQTQAQQTQARNANASATQQGLFVNAGISHEFANWNFDMNSAGSKLHYDNVRWNVFSVDAAYKFGSSTPMQIDAGFKYGMQFGDSTMIDDDITNGGYLITEWWDDTNGDGIGDQFIGSQIGNSLSVGTSEGGDMLGFHAGFGLTNMFKLGGARITPSIGYRYLKYKLETSKDYGMTVDTGYCEVVSGSNETQCNPIIILQYGDAQQVLWEPTYDDQGFIQITPGATGISTEGTYKFVLPGVSHSYETTWMGPYLALDLNYDINAYNSFNARLEFGLPMYNSQGDQPYRVDWQHPKSVEDKGSFGDAWHLGFGANYLTALSESISLSLGFTFDYYSLSGGEANTYLNSGYYMGIYDALLAQYIAAGYTEAYMLENDDNAKTIKAMQDSGWVSKVDGEIESIYKSMGIRVGLQVRF